MLIMRVIFLAFFIVFIPLVTYAATCDTENISEQNCKAIAGCIWNENGTIGPTCGFCPESHWCQNGSAAQCPSDFMHSTSGAKSEYECYKKLDGETGNGHGEKCKGQSDNDIEYSDSDNTKKCRAYYRGENPPFSA